MVRATLTTTPPPETGTFELPELLLNEEVIGQYLEQSISLDNTQTLISASFFLAMAAYDRRCMRDNFQQILMSACNFQNLLLQIAEMGHILGTLDNNSKEDAIVQLKSDMARYFTRAEQRQQELLATLELFGQMRGEDDSVS